MIDIRQTLPPELADIPDEEFRQVQSGETLHDEAFKTKPIGFYKDAMRRLRRNKLSVISLVIILLITLSALIVP